METLESHIEANKKARALGHIDPSEFILKNPFSWNKVFLKQVVKEYQFLKKLAKKVPEWAQKEILGFDKKAIEQCSSSLTASFRFKDIKAKKTVDLTGGFGIDSYYLALKSNKHQYCESNPKLCEIVAYNLGQLNVENVQFSNSSAEAFLQQNKEKFDLVYIDPDRRDQNNGKKFQLEDLSPNLLALQKDFHIHSKAYMIKLSPIIDIQMVIHSLNHVSKVQVIAIKSEVKELIAFVEPLLNKKPTIEAANYNGRNWQIDTITNKKTDTAPIYSSALTYIYEPNGALMKTMAWSYICHNYNLKKLAPMSHYFTSNTLVQNFPGRVLKVNSVFPFRKKSFSNWNMGAFSVLSRNFGKSAEQLRSQFKISESVSDYLIFTSDFNHSKIVIKATKINTI